MFYLLTIRDFRHDICAIPGAGYDASKFANRIQNNGRARLQACDSADSVGVEHSQASVLT